MFATIAGAMATIVMILSFADWFLDKSTKLKIDNSVVDIWSWIDDIKSMPIVDRFRDANFVRQTVLIIRVVCFILSMFIISEVSFFSSGYETLILYLVGIVICFLIMLLSEFVFFKIVKIGNIYVHYALFAVAICAAIGIVVFSLQSSNNDWVSETISDPRFWDQSTSNEISQRKTFGILIYSVLIYL